MRLSSERDSKCFTNDKIASSRTMLIDGHKGTTVQSASTFRLRKQRSRFGGKQQVTLG
jgi:hypothetical protein